MAIEPVRGCGYRRVGGMYLCGDYISVPCDRIPFPLTTCPTCGQGIKVNRGFTEINPYSLFGIHARVAGERVLASGTFGRPTDTLRITYTQEPCKDPIHPCFLCDPKDQPAYIMLVGERFYTTPEDFMEEARRLGVSKRIPFVPKGLELGKTVLYLAHNKAVEVREPVAVQQATAVLENTQTSHPRLLEVEKRPEKRLGIFTAFIPQRVEKLVWKSEATPEELERLTKRGITAVVVPDGDADHKPK